MLLYNIDYELVGLIFTALIFLLHKIRYTAESILNKQFRILTVSVIVVLFTDILSAVFISYYADIPVWLNYVANSANFISMVVTGHEFILYIRTMVIGGKTRANMTVSRVICIVYIAAMIFNGFFGFLFSFTEEGYVHGPLYLLCSGTGMLYIAYAAVYIILKCKKMDVAQLVGSASYVVITMLAALLQVFLVPDILMTGVAMALVLVIMLFFLETPDYVKLQETMDQLEVAKSDAEQASRAKSAFLANMSHEIRTPINAIMGMNEMILRESTEKDVKYYAQNVERASNSLLSLINRILDLSKIESGHIDIECAEYSVAALVEDVTTLVSVRAAGKGLEFTVKADPKLPTALEGDFERIKEIAVNILGNAVKYTNTGTVSFELGVEPVGDGNINLKIVSRDTGIGIREEDRKHLFESFERFDMKKNRAIEGTGLGMAITEKLVNLMNGAIEVESVYGKGSCFTITLPQKVVNPEPIGEHDFNRRISDKPEQKETEATNDTPVKNSEYLVAPDAHVLVVDDNKVNLVVIQSLLKRTQIQTDTASSGRECLEMLKKKHYDVVMLDHMMPELDGIETLEQAKAMTDSLNLETPFIALTANAISGAREFYLEKGFDNYLSKPVRGEELEAMLTGYLKN